MFKERRDSAEELDQRHDTDPLFAFIDSHDRTVHVTQGMADLYIGQGTNIRMWNTCIDPQKPRVQIDLATVDGEETEEQEQFQLIVDKAIQIDTVYKLGSFDKIRDLNLNDLPMLPATILQGIRDALHSMLPGITNEQVNRGALHFFLHILAATGKILPRQLIPQVDHPSISVPRTDEDLRAIQTGAIPDPQGAWFKFLGTDAGKELRPPQALINMLHLLPPLTSLDNGFRLMGQDDMIEVFESLKDSLDSRGDPVQSHLWHLIVQLEPVLLCGGYSSTVSEYSYFYYSHHYSQISWILSYFSLFH